VAATVEQYVLALHLSWGLYSQPYISYDGWREAIMTFVFF